MSSNFAITKIQAITGALQICQVLPAGGVPGTADVTDCTVFLQALLKHWSGVEGYKNWLYATINFPAIAARSTGYTIGETGADKNTARPVKIPQGYTRDSSSNDRPLVSLARQQWEMLTPKNVVGVPNSFYYDPQMPNGIFYPWPILPDTSLTFYLVCQRPITDLAGPDASTFDTTPEWYLAIIWNLALQVMSIYGVEENVCRRIEKFAPVWLEAASTASEEDASTYFMPNPQMRGR